MPSTLTDPASIGGGGTVKSADAAAGVSRTATTNAAQTPDNNLRIRGEPNANGQPDASLRALSRPAMHRLVPFTTTAVDAGVSPDQVRPRARPSAENLEWSLRECARPASSSCSSRFGPPPAGSWRRTRISRARLPLADKARLLSAHAEL